MTDKSVNMFRGLILILLCTQVGAQFFNRCFDQSALDPTENRFVVITLVSEECRTPLVGAKFKQRCFGPLSAELLSMEISPGIYKILLPPRFVRLIAYMDDFRPNSISVGRAELNEFAEMSCLERRCSSVPISLSTTSICENGPLPNFMASSVAVDVESVADGVFEMHVCSLPADVVTFAGDKISTLTVTGSSDITYDCSGMVCPLQEPINVVVESECDESAVTSATLTGAGIWTGGTGGYYELLACSLPFTGTLSAAGYSDTVFTINTIDDPVVVILDCEMACDLQEPIPVHVVSYCGGIAVTSATLTCAGTWTEGSGGDYELTACSLPFTGTLSAAGHTDTMFTIANLDNPVVVILECECISSSVTLVSACGKSVTGATFSGWDSMELLPDNPGQYAVQTCGPLSDVTINIDFHQSLEVPANQFTSMTTFTLQCTESLVMVIHPQTKFRKEGEVATLCCEAYSEPGNQLITYSWKKDGIPVSGGIDGTLVLTALANGDNGMYVCTAAIESQGIQVQSTPAFLIITNFDFFDVYKERRTVCENNVWVNRCPPVTCVYPGDSPGNCHDAGLVSVATTRNLFVNCGTATISLKEADTCECVKAAAPTLTVTVIAFDTSAPLADVEVRIAGKPGMSTTDAGGKVTLTVPAGMLTAVLHVMKTSGGYLPSTQPVDIDEQSTSTTVYLITKAAPFQLQPDIENVISLSDNPLNPNNGAVTFVISANSFYRSGGGAPVPPVQLSLTYMEPTIDNLGQAPGVFLSTDENGWIVPIETQGVFAITATDANGEPLDSSPITVISKDGFDLFSLNANGMWTRITPLEVAARRRRRAIDVGTVIGHITIASNQVQWYNIDRFPENTPCWFKTYVRDAATNTALQDPWLRRYIVATSLQSSNMTSILQLSNTTMNMDKCFEARCDSSNTGSLPKGYIAVDALGDVASIHNRATPMVLSDYAMAVQARLNTLQFDIDAQDRLSLDLEASANGPFFNNKTACKLASFASGDNVLGFVVDNPSVNTDPYGDSNDRCVARVKVNITYEESSTFTAISLWGDNLFYKQYNTTVDNNTNMAALCFNYRCSLANDMTNVVISFATDRSGDAFLHDFKYGCNITFTAPVINPATGNGYFLNTSGDEQAPLDSCNAQADTDPFVLEKRCPEWENHQGFGKK